MEFKIENTEVYGIEKSVVNSGNSFRTSLRTSADIIQNDWDRSKRLGNTTPGSGHDSFLNGCLVNMDVTAPLYWWKQAQRYHWLEFISSQSTMHCVLKFNVKDRCVEDVDERVVSVIEELIKKYNEEINAGEKNNLWRSIIASLPCGFCLTASMTTNYRQLKTICKQRIGHPLKEWKTFIDWCHTLPHFDELTGLGNPVQLK